MSSLLQCQVYGSYRLRDIDRGIGDLAIIAAPRDRTISHMKASLTSALLNSSHGTHRAIIIVRTVIGRRLKGPDRWPVSDRAPRCDHAVQHRTHYITSSVWSVLCPLTSSLFKPPITTAAAGRELRGWPAPHVILTPVSASCPSNRGVQIVKVWSVWVLGVQPKIHVRRQKQYAINAVRSIGMLP